ncbi:YkgJ family cysteine cluster protein [Floridanema aerugineum]|uniref:YkgJ family cysteine cluster protein n=1 Tax=Floridaenema aerugineum BLCC-F46 TaxID=3153654 RepID=A0ABV4XFF7_9CYAN
MTNIISSDNEEFPELPNLPQAGILEDLRSRFPEIDRTTIIKEFPSGQIRLEAGSDGLFLVFDLDCLDALPYCKAHCCGHIGTVVLDEEVDDLNSLSQILEKRLLTYNHYIDKNRYEMKRDCDGLCAALDRKTRTCEIYENRPRTCRVFHCSRGLNRGFRLMSVSRQKELELM